jgi:hypothetical protein
MKRTFGSSRIDEALRKRQPLIGFNAAAFDPAAVVRKDDFKIAGPTVAQAEVGNWAIASWPLA